jgi:uncharacterized protein YjbJ (UPF0337 family)
MRFGRLPIIHRQEWNMAINKDQVEGRAREVAGKVQQEIGKLTGNKTQQVKGAIKKNIGAGQAKLGDMAEDLAERTRDTNRKP